jgi:PE-PGRS family protein with aspartyl peptidase-like domain
MTHRHAGKRRRRLLSGIGVGAGAFVAAAAVATSSATPAQADFEDLLDPIVQPILTSLTDSIAVFDPAAALDLTSWADSLLASLNSSFDFALPSADSAVAAASTGAEPAASGASYTLPITMQIVTEPTIQAAIGAGDPSTLLVDTGSSGLVVPWQELGSNDFAALEELFKLGMPDNYGFSGYSGGVEYLYLTYNDVPVDYGTDGADALSTTSPVDVEVLSWSTNPANIFENFQTFLSSNHVDGILGIGPDTAGPTASPFENYGGVLVDLVGADKSLVVGGDNPLTGGTLLTGSPTVDGLTEKVFSSTGTLIGSTTVSNDLDSGGVYGTIPSSIVGQGLTAGDKVAVYTSSGQELYEYVIGTDSIGQSTAPTSTSSDFIDSGVVPFLSHEAYFDYATDKTYWGPLTT